jgi:hypothetical protein
MMKLNLNSLLKLKTVFLTTALLGIATPNFASAFASDKWIKFEGEAVSKGNTYLVTVQGSVLEFNKNDVRHQGNTIELRVGSRPKNVPEGRSCSWNMTSASSVTSRKPEGRKPEGFAYCLAVVPLCCEDHSVAKALCIGLMDCSSKWRVTGCPESRYNNGFGGD